MEKERKKFGKGRNRTQVDRIKKEFGMCFTICSTGIAQNLVYFVVTLYLVVVVVALYCHLVTSTSEISHQPAHT